MKPIVTLASSSPSISVAGLLGPAIPDIVDGFGGVNEIERRRLRPLTDSDTIPLIKQTFELVFSGYAEGRVVDAEVSALEQLAGLGRTSPRLPVVRLSGPVRKTEIDWQIAGLARIDTPETIRDRDGRFLQVAFALTLVEHNGSDVVAVGPGTGARVYVVKSGDTLKKIAHKLLGDSRRWTEIAKLNSLTKSGGLTTGRRLRVPPK